MKTKNNIQKTALTAVAVAGLVIFSFTANAQFAMTSLFKDKELSNKAMAMGKTSNNLGTTAIYARNFTGANTFATYLMPETEESLQLEDWMTDESSFATALKIETETEYPLQVESWMTNEKTFGFNSIDMKIETEKPMSLEGWMINPKTWKN